MPTPLRSILESAGASFIPFGPGECAVEIVETFGHYEAEYAMFRKGVAILHEPQRGLVEMRGKEVRDFLHRMLTQDVNTMPGGATRRAFQINEKGRIVADVLVHHGDESTWLDGDACDLPALLALYDQRLFGEDVTLRDITAERTCVALFGPRAGELLRAACDDEPARAAVQRMLDMPGTHHVVSLAGAAVTAYRYDLGAKDKPGSVTGVRLWPTVDHCETLYRRLTDLVGGVVPNVDVEAGGTPKRDIPGRAVGWLAFNTARIEAAAPLFHVDFGPDSLPHETGSLHETVSFKKGCYLAQEIVARMQNLGHPKRVIVALRFPDDRMPIAGSQVLDAQGAVVGGVSSSTLSPLAGNTAVALASVKWGKHNPGTTLNVPAEGELVNATVQPIT